MHPDIDHPSVSATEAARRLGIVRTNCAAGGSSGSHFSVNDRAKRAITRHLPEDYDQSIRDARHWRRPLTHPIKHRYGTLVTLKVAGDFMSLHWKDVIQSPVVEHTFELLLIAGKSGKPADIEAATRQVSILLSTRGLLIAQ
jgi:hypothetical protein